MRRRLGKLLGLVAGLYLAVALGVSGYAMLASFPAPEAVVPTDRIVVLGAGLTPDGTLGIMARRRVLHGVALFRAGAAPGLHMTGGTEAPDGRRAAEMMRDLAVSRGVPAAAVTVEARSHSTLQNALFSQPMLDGAESLRLVSHAYHLPRAWASFAWAGDQRLRLDAAGRRWPGLRRVLLEAGAWGVNLVRAPLYDLAGLVGLPEPLRRAMLH